MRLDNWSPPEKVFVGGPRLEFCGKAPLVALVYLGGQTNFQQGANHTLQGEFALTGIHQPALRNPHGTFTGMLDLSQGRISMSAGQWISIPKKISEKAVIVGESIDYCLSSKNLLFT